LFSGGAGSGAVLAPSTGSSGAFRPGTRPEPTLHNRRICVAERPCNSHTRSRASLSRTPPLPPLGPGNIECPGSLGLGHGLVPPMAEILVQPCRNHHDPTPQPQRESRSLQVRSHPRNVRREWKDGAMVWSCVHFGMRPLFTPEEHDGELQSSLFRYLFLLTRLRSRETFGKNSFFIHAGLVELGLCEVRLFKIGTL